jgi:hypothetical protein
MPRSELAQYVKEFERELEYYKNLAKEQREIIEQLTGTGKPKGYIYMHPYDLHEYVQNCKVSNLFVTDGTQRTINGRNIRLSASIPPTSKNYIFEK